jgi:hypothetical protein
MCHAFSDYATLIVMWQTDTTLLIAITSRNIISAILGCTRSEKIKFSSFRFANRGVAFYYEMNSQNTYW